MALTWNQIPVSMFVCCSHDTVRQYRVLFLLNSEAQSRQNRRMSQSFSKSEVVCFHLLSGTGVGKMLVHCDLGHFHCRLYCVVEKKRRNYYIWKLYAQNNLCLFMHSLFIWNLIWNNETWNYKTWPHVYKFKKAKSMCLDPCVPRSMNNVIWKSKNNNNNHK